MSDEVIIDRAYKCKVDLALPSPIYAQYLKDVLSVDGELGNKITKSFSIVSVSEMEGHSLQDAERGEEMRILRM
jgi:hypothetical protein